tara:strand:+ start:1074 stop:1580 length:507 start_codon:yes stop_codon:yes gene_type:complete
MGCRISKTNSNPNYSSYAMRDKSTQSSSAASTVPQHHKNKPYKRFTMRSFGLYVTLLFCLVLFVGFLMEQLSLLVLFAYSIISILTFLVYAWDKAAAKRNSRRIPEKYIHILALACGWPGAVVAQRFIRHKSSKRRFQIMFWLTVVGNCLLIWGISRSGQRLLASLVG